MSWHARILCCLYTLTALGLACCAVVLWRAGLLWAALLYAAASLVPVIAGVREADHADDRRTAREARLTARRAAVAEAVALAELADACCEPWWTSCGDDHDPSCPNQQRSSAA